MTKTLLQRYSESLPQELQQKVRRIGAHRKDNPQYRLLFHDTHHRAVTEPQGMAAYDLRHYDGVLAFGSAIRDIYQRQGWAQRAWTWHEAADPRVFHPIPGVPREGAALGQKRPEGIGRDVLGRIDRQPFHDFGAGGVGRGKSTSEAASLEPASRPSQVSSARQSPRGW